MRRRNLKEGMMHSASLLDSAVARRRGVFAAFDNESTVVATGLHPPRFPCVHLIATSSGHRNRKMFLPLFVHGLDILISERYILS